MSEPPRRPAPQRRWRLIAAAAAIPALAVGAFLIGRPADDGSAPVPGPAVSPKAPEATARPATVRAPAGSPADLVAALTTRLTGAAAPTDRALAKDVRKRLARIADRLAAGKLAEAADQVRDLRRRLDDGVREGDWGGDPATERLLDRLAGRLPSGPAGRPVPAPARPAVPGTERTAYRCRPPT